MATKRKAEANDFTWSNERFRYITYPVDQHDPSEGWEAISLVPYVISQGMTKKGAVANLEDRVKRVLLSGRDVDSATELEAAPAEHFDRYEKLIGD